jgi:hypothetical protein
MKTLDLFFTEATWRDVLKDAQELRPLKYTVIKPSPLPAFSSLSTEEFIKQLDFAKAEQTNLCISYLVTDENTNVIGRRVEQYDGNTRFHIDQFVNPDSVVLVPAGRWESDVIIAGRLATISNSPASLSIFKILEKLIKKRSVRVKRSWLSPEAEAVLSQGGRLTQAVQSPVPYALCQAN